MKVNIIDGNILITAVTKKEKSDINDLFLSAHQKSNKGTRGHFKAKATFIEDAGISSFQIDFEIEP